jgi:glucosamine 6-phosphate synthetase-like amidotransferase/phosphosugar isomerase protein
MCGIFGLITSPNTSIPAVVIKKTISKLMILSEMRGKESSGLAWKAGSEIGIYKRPIPASALAKDKNCLSLIRKAYQGNNSSIAIIGHARLATNGTSNINSNNQPIKKNGLVAVHNGIIVNHLELRKSNPDNEMETETDTEGFLAYLNYLMQKTSLIKAAHQAISNVQGSASIALLANISDDLLLATNTGSLYTLASDTFPVSIFASENTYC